MAVLDRPADAGRPHPIASPPGTGGEATRVNGAPGLRTERLLMKGNEAIAEAAIAAGSHRYSVHVDRRAWERTSGIAYADIARDDGLPAWSR